MSKVTRRATAAPDLARIVPSLSPETLHQLVRARGLDACSEIVTSATPAQLTSLLDLDLWRHTQPGRDEQFDVDRFGEWVEALVDAGDAVAARTVAALDTNLVVAGLSRYVRVFDPGIFEPTAQSDDEPMDRHESMREGGGGGVECEVGGYLIRARRADAWDAIITLLTALESEYPDSFHAVMRGCRLLSNSRPEPSGMDDLLPAPEQHLHDVAIERERRRSQQGYATPADARAFLQMARQPSSGINPIVAAYFRAVQDASQSPNEMARSPEQDAPESRDAVMALLAEAGVEPEHPRALLAPADAGPEDPSLTRLQRLMAYVHDRDDTAFIARSGELAFLANTLLAGCAVQARPFTPREASDAAAAICNLGLEYWPARWPGVASPATSPPDAWLLDHDLVAAFEAGWSVLHQDVSLFAAEQLIAALSDVDSVDRDIRRGLDELRRALVRERDAGTPWRARDAAEILAMLDMTAWIGVLGLLDECPVLPAALVAVLEGRTTPVSATAFDFIATAAHVGDARAFMRKLPGLLSR